MKILMVGSGGREHALIKKLKESEAVTEVICAPGNGGISVEATCFPVKATDIDGIINLALCERVDLVFVAPDDPLALGLVDACEKAGLRAFGPNSEAAIIESSKVFSKELMKKYSIPTADYFIFDDPEKAIEHIKNSDAYPVVIKADGLALGKGVLIAYNYEEAENAVKLIMRDKVFGTSGNSVVVEEFLTGPEVTVMAFTDSKTVIPMVSSKDHKRALDGDKGANTGGMGTISPNPHYDIDAQEYCMEHIFLPTVHAMNKEGRPFKGCLYFGLMLTPKGPKVIEYNARFGDPETQVVLSRLITPLIDIVQATIDERLDEIDIKWDADASACVIMASGGYPGDYKKGYKISGLDKNGQLAGVTVYHSGTIIKNQIFLTNGGRVLGVTTKAGTLNQALEKAYSAVKKIDFQDAFYRKDIGE